MPLVWRGHLNAFHLAICQLVREKVMRSQFVIVGMLLFDRGNQRLAAVLSSWME